MKRRIVSILLVSALMLTGATASAATRLTKYDLVANGERAQLSLDTGYLFRQGSYLMVPVEQVCKLMGLGYEVNDQKSGMTVTAENGKKVEIRLNSKLMRVDGAMKPLRTKTIRQDGKKLTADVRLLTELGLSFKHHKAGSATRALGYGSGVLAVAKAGGDLTLPNIAPVITLPDAVAGAASSATQIVAVRHTGGSSARLTFYQKAGGKWREEFSATAYVGRNGIGKMAEGDGKTPTGTFNLTQPFGILKNPGTKLGNYVKVTKYHYWSGQEGPYYNRLVDTRKVKSYKPTSADEHLIDYKGVYNYCMFIDYNKEGAAGKGSAIFLHCTGSGTSTGGCVAVSQQVMLTLMKTLKPGATIVIYA